MAAEQRFSVVIAGGGVAALEAALALEDLAGELVEVAIIAPDSELVYRPATIAEPFSYAPARRYPLSALADDAGAQLIVDRLSWVEPSRHMMHTEQGSALHYDALLLALGASQHAAFEHAVTIDDRRMDEALHGLIEDVEGGYVRSIAFVSPSRMAWPLPLYELALLTAHRAYEMGEELEVTIVTPEDLPLEVFGGQASDAVAELLAAAGIVRITATGIAVPESRRVVLPSPERLLEVDRVVALPELFGPAVRGVPGGEQGFIPIDSHCQIVGAPGVFAAGDATDYPIKQGGIAAQQADVAAAAIAALAGAEIEQAPLRPQLHGMLLTGGRPLYLTASITGGRGLHSEVSEHPTWSPPGKIAARYLAPCLERHDETG